MHSGERDLIDFALGDGISLSPVQQAINWIIYSFDEAGELSYLMTRDQL